MTLFYIKRCSMFKTIAGTKGWFNSFFIIVFALSALDRYNIWTDTIYVRFWQMQYMVRYNIYPILTNAIHGPTLQIFNLCRQFTRNCPLHNFGGQVFSSSPPEEGFLDWIECVQSDFIFAQDERIYLSETDFAKKSPSRRQTAENTKLSRNLPWFSNLTLTTIASNPPPQICWSFFYQVIMPQWGIFW